ncbi:MAG: hypothetical protein JRF15_16015 [Deltaproteobacteria bacterium]|jgi:hypothetical protein|nr:hypothetical protein [Deltaproteobacteria bacterium]
MSSTSKLLLAGLLSIGVGAATAARAGNQLFEASWSVKSFGNECSIAASGASPGPYCGKGGPESSLYSAFGMPQGIQCSPKAPRCPFDSTPTNGTGMFAPLGGSQHVALYCAPWANWRGHGTTARPARGETQFYTGKNAGPIPPLYRNPAFFTAGGEPNTTFCTATSRSVLGGKGRVQAGNPVTGKWGATTTTGGAFYFAAAPANGGVRVDAGVGEFAALYPYIYSYTYATLRNGAGIFGPSSGPGDFSVKKYQGANTIARMRVKQGAAKFGGTMTMLGALTSKVCYYRNGGCSLGSQNWRYDAIGTPAQTFNGVVTNGYVVTWNCWYYYYPTPALSGICVEGSRFPWTTGSVTVTAVGRGPHKTVHYAKGYDNRTPTSGKGTIQMVSPVLTRWLQPAVNFETGGIAILRIKFIPEPHAWAMLIAGVSLLGFGARLRRR